MKSQNGEEYVRRGDIYYADLSPVVGSEQGGIRPVLIGITILVIVLLLNSCKNNVNPVVARPINCIKTIKTPNDMSDCLIEYDTEYGSIMKALKSIDN